MGIGSAGKRIKVTKADLKKPLLPPAPGLRPATKADIVKALRARQEFIHKQALNPRKARISGRLIAEGKVGTRYSDWRILDLRRISGSRNPNAELAKKALIVYEHLQGLSFEIPIREHQALVNVANKVVKVALRKGTAVLTPLEAKTLEFYYNNASR